MTDRTAENAREIARWHGQKMAFRRDGKTETVASYNGYDGPTGIDLFVDRRWQEYTAVAEYVEQQIASARREAFEEAAETVEGFDLSEWGAWGQSRLRDAIATALRAKAGEG